MFSVGVGVGLRSVGWRGLGIGGCIWWLGESWVDLSVCFDVISRVVLYVRVSVVRGVAACLVPWVCNIFVSLFDYVYCLL